MVPPLWVVKDNPLSYPNDEYVSLGIGETNPAKAYSEDVDNNGRFGLALRRPFNINPALIRTNHQLSAAFMMPTLLLQRVSLFKCCSYSNHPDDGMSISLF